MILKILNILAFLLGIYIVKKGIDHNKTKALEINEETFLLPEELNYLYKDMTYLNRAIVVTLLDLYRRGKIDIEKYVRPSRNKSKDFVIEYKFKLLDFEDLKDHEIYFLQTLFEDEKETDTDKLSKRALFGKEFFQKQGNWSNLLEEELKNLNIFEDRYKKESNILKIIGLVALAIGAYSFVQEEILGLLSILAASGILLIGINLGIDKSEKGKELLNHYTELENKGKNFEYMENLSEKELINLLALSLTMKYFIPIYEQNENYKTIDLITDSINPYGGSYFDDAILRGFMGFTAETRDDTLDTNRIDYKLFK